MDSTMTRESEPSKRSRLSLKNSSMRQKNIKLKKEHETVRKSDDWQADDIKRATEADESSLQETDADDGKPKLAAVASLDNMGNTCFLNSVIQILRYTPGLVADVSYLSKEIQFLDHAKKQQGIDEDVSAQWQLLTILTQLFTQMNRAEDYYKVGANLEELAVKPNRILECIRDLNPMFEGNLQHDAQELLRCILCYIQDASKELVTEKNKMPGLEDLHINHNIKVEIHSKEQCSSPLKPLNCDTQVSPTGRRSLQSPNKYVVKVEDKIENESYSDSEMAEKRKNSVDESWFPDISPLKQSSSIGCKKSCSDVGSSSAEPSSAAQPSDDQINQTPPKYTSPKLSIRNNLPFKNLCMPKTNMVFNGVPAPYSPDTNVVSVHAVPVDRVDGLLNDPMSPEAAEAMDADPPPTRDRNRFRAESPTVSSVRFTGSTYSRKRNSSSDLWSSAVASLAIDPVVNSSDALLIVNDRDEEEDDDDDDRKVIYSCETKSTRKIQSPKKNCRKSSISIAGDNKEKLINTYVSESNDKNSSQGRHLSPNSSVTTCDTTATVTPGKGNSQLDLPMSASVAKKGNHRSNSRIPCNSAPSLVSHGRRDAKSSCKRQRIFSKDDSCLGRKNKLLSPESDQLNNSNHSCPRKRSMDKSACDSFTDEIWQRRRRSDKRRRTRSNSKTSINDNGEISFNNAASLVSNTTGDMSCNLRNNCGGRLQSNTESFFEITPCKRLGVRGATARQNVEKNADGSIKVCGGNKDAVGMSQRSESALSVDQSLLDETPRNIRRTPVRQAKLNHSALKTSKSSSVRKLSFADSSEMNSSESHDFPCSRNLNGSFRDETDDGHMPLNNLTERELKHDVVCGSRTPVVCLQKLEDSEVVKRYPGISASLSKTMTLQSDYDEKRVHVVENNFQGEMILRTKCLECENFTERTEGFQDISIPVKSQEDSADDELPEEVNEEEDTYREPFEWMLAGMSEVERLQDDNKYFCDSCLHLTEAERSLHYMKIPEILTFHLKRFAASSGVFGGVIKINDQVKTPFVFPCFSAACTQPCHKHNYRLYGMIMHCGVTLSAGHYTAYVRMPPPPKKYKNERGQGDAFPSDEVFTDYDGESKFILLKDNLGGKWLECDDNIIHAYTEEQFDELLSSSSNCTPYVLFYHHC